MVLTWNNKMPVIQIKEFPNDERVWRIDWFGAVRKNDNVPTEPIIDVYLRPVSVTDKTSIADFGWLNKERICCPIGVGQLPVFTIGSLWKNGKLLDYQVIVPSNLQDVWLLNLMEIPIQSLFPLLKLFVFITPFQPIWPRLLFWGHMKLISIKSSVNDAVLIQKPRFS